MSKVIKDIIIPFSKLGDVEVEFIGLKAANLGVLVSKRIPVPNGFVITTDAFGRYLVDNKLSEFIDKELYNLDLSDSVSVESVSKKIRSSILKYDLSKDLKKVISRAYASLSGFTDTYVAVRSSLLFDSMKRDTFSGEYSSFLNIKGKNDVIEKIKCCWASLFTPQNLFNSLSIKKDLSSLKMAVIVQKMIQSEVSGMLFSINPIDNDETKISIEAVLGLGEVLATGQLVPDTYLVGKGKEEIIEKKIVPQEWMMVRKGRSKKGEDPNVKVKVSDVWKVRQKLESKYINKLVKLGKDIEKKLAEPQEIEWTYEGGRIWIVQTRAITKLKIDEGESWKKTPTFAALRARVESAEDKRVDVQKEKKVKNNIQKAPQKRESDSKNKDEDNKVILSGEVTNDGIVAGAVKIINSKKDLKNIKKGTVIVADKVTSEFEGKLDNVIAIITDVRNKDSYETIMAKGLGIPCVVNTNIATKVLRNNELITVDGSRGDIITGATREALIEIEKMISKNVKEEKESGDKKEKKRHEKVDKKVKEVKKTATKIFIDLDELNRSPSLVDKNIDGVANVSLRDIFTDETIHPQSVLKRKKDKEKYINDIVTGVFRVAKSFDPRPVIYKLSDLSTTEYAELKSGHEIESSEENPLLGYRGTYRLISSSDELELELEAIRIIRNKEGIKNVWIAAPFVRTYREMKELKKLLSSFGFRRSSTFKLLLTVQVPSVAVTIDKVLDLGIDGVVFDIDMLSQLMLGVDKANPKISKEYNGTHKSVLWALKRVIKACNKNKVHSQVYSRSVASNPDLIKKIVEFGATSVLVDLEMLDQTRDYIYDAEKSLITKKKK